jgi:capsular exopolysaccharide synthesis family protein
MSPKERPIRTIYDDFDPEAPETTEFRRVYARVTGRSQPEKLRTLLFTSAERGEGKTTSSVLFSLVSSLHQGARTCIVDADLHRPRLDQMLDVPREPGLAEVLAENFPIESCIKTTRHENLKVIPAGARRPYPSELLQPDALAATIGKLRLLFDIIVIDAPPLLPVSDPAILSREVDGVVLVVRAGKTRRDVILRGKKILEDVGANVIGVIVNNADDVLPYHYGHQYYRYSYAQDEPAQAKEDRRRAEQRAQQRLTGKGEPKKVTRTGPFGPKE